MSGSLFALGLLIVSAEPSWDMQLQEPFDLSRNVEWLALDPDNHEVEEIIALRRRGVKLMCHVNIGTLEEWRRDTAAFPTAVLAPPQADWEGERFLDTRQLDVLVPLMTSRFQRCAALGFDAVEADNLDSYENITTLPLTPEHNLAYVHALAEAARGLNLSIGQKNAPELAEALAGSMDFMVVDSCFRWEWCDAVSPYVEAGKPVFGMEFIEAEIDWAKACAQAEALGILMILKSDALDMSRLICGDTS